MTERAHAGPDLGTDTTFGGWWSKQRDRHSIWPWRPDGSGRRGAGIGEQTRFWAFERCRLSVIHGTSLPVYRSGTFNVQHSTLNLQRGDRKGVWLAGCGDRHDIHDIWAPGFLTRTSPSACQPVETHWGPPLSEKGDRHGVSLCAGDRTLDPPDLTKRLSDGRGWLRHPDMGTDTKFKRPDS